MIYTNEHIKMMDGKLNMLASIMGLNLDSSNNIGMADAFTKGGNNFMPSNFRERINIGKDAQGNPIYDWARGKTQNDLYVSAVKALLKNGIIELNDITKEEITPQATTGSITYGEYLKNFMNTYKVGIVKDTTMVGYNASMNKHLIPAFGHLQLTEITTDMIQGVLNTKKNLAKKTIREILNLMRESLDYAVEDGLLTKNPAASKRIKNPGKPPVKRKVLTRAQSIEVLNNLHKLTLDERRLIAIMLFTGARRGEALGLQWGDINIEANLIHIRRGVTFAKNQPQIGTTKTENSIRDLPLCDELKAIIFEESPPSDSSQFLFGGNKPLTLCAYNWRWKKIKGKIRVGGADKKLDKRGQ